MWFPLSVVITGITKTGSSVDGAFGGLNKGPNPGKWARGFNQDAIACVADPAALETLGGR